MIPTFEETIFPYNYLTIRCDLYLNFTKLSKPLSLKLIKEGLDTPLVQADWDASAADKSEQGSPSIKKYFHIWWCFWFDKCDVGANQPMHKQIVFTRYTVYLVIFW